MNTAAAAVAAAAELLPLLNRKQVAHGQVTPRTNGREVFQDRCAALAFRDVVAAMKVVHRDYVCAPCDGALGVVHASDSR